MKHGDFTELAKHYHNRPAYSPFLLSKLIACINEQGLANEDLKVVEVGAGTGKLTTILARDFNLNVTTVEPNDAMRTEGEKATQGLSVKWTKGSGEDTNLPSNSADWLIMASSFHWTDPSKSLHEFARVLKTHTKNNMGATLTFLSFLIHATLKKIRFSMKLRKRLRTLCQSLVGLAVLYKTAKIGTKCLYPRDISPIVFLWSVLIVRFGAKSVIWARGTL